MARNYAEGKEKKRRKRKEDKKENTKDRGRGGEVVEGSEWKQEDRNGQD